MLERLGLRLTLAYVGVLALILLLFSAVTLAVYRGQTLARQDEALAHEAARIALRRAAGDPPDGRMDESDDYGYVVLDPTGRVLERDSTAPSLGLPASGAFGATLDRGATRFATVGGPDGRVRLASFPDRREGEIVAVVQIATPLRLALEPVSRLALLVLPIGLGALALAAAGGLVMARRAMRPVRDAFGRQRAFIADASHELKTPLSLIKLDAEVLLRNPVAPDGEEILRHQVAEIDRMDVLLAELLLLARLDAAKLPVARARFDLTAIMAAAAERFRAKAAAGGIALQVGSASPLPARGDAERTAQILSALLDNVLRFTPAGGSVTLAGGRCEGRVEAMVEDTGPGLDPEQVARVFDRFYRGDGQRSGRSRDGGGSGLGLAIAREMARAQGGELAVGIGAGGGVRATLSLPADG